MKRFWLILLSMGMVTVLSVSAYAADVKFSGQYYVAGMYLNHVDIRENSSAAFTRSTAFFYQRLRLGTDFIVSPCLKLVTRMDIMERVWEPDSVSNYAPVVYDTSVDSSGAATKAAAGHGNADARNWDFDHIYIDYASSIGQFQVGFMPDLVWGTKWGNNSAFSSTGQIKYFLPIGPVKMLFAYVKKDEKDYWKDDTKVVANDRDYDSYRLGPLYKFKSGNVSGETGILFIYDHDARFKGTDDQKTDTFVLQPYFKGKFGPISLQGEINYAFGQVEYDSAADQDISSFTAFLDADAKFGMFTVGGSLAFVQGDNDSTDDEINNALTGGPDLDPCWMMFNHSTLNSWVGGIKTHTNKVGGEMTNAWFGQLRAGIAPTSKLKLVASVSYAKADKEPTGYIDDEYGWEIDLTGTYKITNNLSYMLGAGYLFTGDYYKGTSSSHQIEDNYMLINKLTLDF
ncbi:MAG: hypothetical protein JW976_10475 [Syntrophaceae bacterium]|nr:hypothetical protein [Syntrophaceae bacterium]